MICPSEALWGFVNLLIELILLLSICCESLWLLTVDFSSSSKFGNCTGGSSGEGKTILWWCPSENSIDLPFPSSDLSFCNVCAGKLGTSLGLMPLWENSTDFLGSSQVSGDFGKNKDSVGSWLSVDWELTESEVDPRFWGLLLCMCLKMKHHHTTRVKIANVPGRRKLNGFSRLLPFLGRWGCW